MPAPLHRRQRERRARHGHRLLALRPDEPRPEGRLGRRHADRVREDDSPGPGAQRGRPGARERAVEHGEPPPQRDLEVGREVVLPVRPVVRTALELIELRAAELAEQVPRGVHELPKQRLGLRAGARASSQDDVSYNKLPQISVV